MSKVCIFIESDKETTNEGHFVRHMATLVYAGDSKEIEIVGTGGIYKLEKVCCSDAKKYRCRNKEFSDF